MADDADITPAILLQHMQGMEQRLLHRIDDVKIDLTSFKTEVNGRLDKLDRRISLLSVQIGNLDERLDDLEVVQVPILKKAVGIAA